jgi:hypothetical protein
MASTECHYGLIPKEEWNQPDWSVISFSLGDRHIRSRLTDLLPIHPIDM